MRIRAASKFFKLSRRQKWLLVEAQVLLLLARLALACLPFRVVAKWLNRPVPLQHMPQSLRIQYIQEVRWAIGLCATSGLINAVCFPQGLCAMRMLNRRGLAPTLYYGVNKDPGQQLQAHVWVKDRDLYVVGERPEMTFTILDTFPQQSMVR